MSDTTFITATIPVIVTCSDCSLWPVLSMSREARPGAHLSCGVRHTVDAQGGTLNGDNVISTRANKLIR